MMRRDSNLHLDPDFHRSERRARVGNFDPLIKRSSEEKKKSSWFIYAVFVCALVGAAVTTSVSWLLHGS